MQISAEAAASFFYALLQAIGAGHLRFWNLPNQQISEFGGQTMFDMKACGDRVRELRESRMINGKTMTRQRLAEELNISMTHLWRIESGDRAASVDLLIEIAEYFSVSLDYLVLGKAAEDTALRRRVKDLAAELAAMTEKL